MQRAWVVDIESLTPGQTYRPIATFTALDAENKAVALLERLDQVKVKRGGYAIDVAVYCYACKSYHHEDAECVEDHT